MVFDGEPVIGKPDRCSTGQRVQMYCPGNELGQLREIGDTLKERYVELLKDRCINPWNEVFQILARTIEIEPSSCK